MSEQFERTSRYKEIQTAFLKNLDYLTPRYRALSEASDPGMAIPEFGDTYDKLLDVAKEAPPEVLATMLQAAVDAAVWTVEQFPTPGATQGKAIAKPMSGEVEQADAQIRFSGEATVHRLHPDADAGLAQFLMVVAAVGAVKAGRPAILDMQGETDSFLINGPALIEQLMEASWGTVQRAIRPIFNEIIISAFATLQTKYGIKAGDARPEVEFLRHARNASAHGNVFTIRGKEPIMPAKWNGKEISRDLNGTVLIYKFLKPGDVLRLIDNVFQLVDPK